MARKRLPKLNVADESFLFIYELYSAAETGRIGRGWIESPYFAFGQTCVGDVLLYCCCPPDRPPGSIVIAQHENDEFPLVILGDSLSQWLARFIACDCREYALFTSWPWSVPETLERDFLADHLRLNPTDEKALERQARLSVEPNAPPCTVFRWDYDLHILRPVWETPDLEELDLTLFRGTDLTGIGTLQRLRVLVLSYTRVRNLASLSELRELRALHIDNTPVNDLRPLANLHSLEDLFAADSQVCDLEPLRGLTSLRRLFLERTPVSDIGPLWTLPHLEVLGLSFSDILSPQIDGLREHRPELKVYVEKETGGC